jgi:3-deoxy-D-manno-octulosonic-acid transferase
MPNPLDIAYVCGLGAAAPWLLRRKSRAQLIAKLTGRVTLPAKTGPRVWFHAVSVGEVHLLRTLVASFRERLAGVDTVISSTTTTGLTEARRIFRDLAVVPYPFDFSWAVRRARRAIRPDAIVLAESELWPGLLLDARRAGVPVVVVNGRLSPRSLKRWQFAGPLARMLFGRVAHFAAQSPDYRDNLLRLGVPPGRVTVTGSIKYDGVETCRDNPATLRLRALFAIRPDDVVLVAGSTQAPEEQGVLDVYKRLRSECGRLRLIVVPRQAERFEEVAGLLRRSGEPFMRRSALADPTCPRNEVILLDSIGELRAAWGLADIAFVGGSLDGRRGGQNMIEPAAYGAAVVFGDQVWNFRATADALVGAGGAVRVRDFAGLGESLHRFLDPVVRQGYGAAATRFVRSQQGAADRTVDVIRRTLIGDASK